MKKYVPRDGKTDSKPATEGRLFVEKKYFKSKDKGGQSKLNAGDEPAEPWKKVVREGYPVRAGKGKSERAAERPTSGNSAGRNPGWYSGFKPFGGGPGNTTRQSVGSRDGSEVKAFERPARNIQQGDKRSGRPNQSSERPFHKVTRSQGFDKTYRSGDRNQAVDKPFREENGRKPYSGRGLNESGSRGVSSKTTWPDRPRKSSASSPSLPRSAGKPRPFEKYRLPEKPVSRDPAKESRFESRTSDRFADNERRMTGRAVSNSKRPQDRRHEGLLPVSVQRLKTAATETRLNKYIANAGICARRKADEMIAQGLIQVNGAVVTEMGFKVKPGDKVKFQERNLHPEEMIYVLLNKPKDYITTTDDPQERKTVMELVSTASEHRIYPVGRLDRNTSGLLLFTNDGALAEKLSHPAGNIIKLYHVSLDKSLSKTDMEKIVAGLELEDGKIVVDEISYVAGESHKEIGIQIHSGRNRVVRRIFESLGYEVVKLDRVIYASLTKKDLSRGRWRYLSAKEVIQLKHFIH